MTGYAFLETSMDPTWQTQEVGKFFERGSRKGWVGTVYARPSRGYNFFLLGTQGAREIASDVHLDGRTSSRKIPGVGKGLIEHKSVTYLCKSKWLTPFPLPGAFA